MSAVDGAAWAKAINGPVLITTASISNQTPPTAELWEGPVLHPRPVRMELVSALPGLITKSLIVAISGGTPPVMSGKSSAAIAINVLEDKILVSLKVS